MLRLLKFPVNSAWAFVFGDDLRTAKPITLANFPLFFQTKGEAIEAARHRGLKVDLKSGITTAEQEQT